MDEQKIKEQSRVGGAGSKVDPPRETRRRGEILETAILQAAWDELSDVGYTHLTIEGVAVRARTNKAVVYRRWGNKAKLVVATLQRYLPKPPRDVPDTGNLRNDMLILLRGIAQPLQTVGAETIQGLMAEYLSKDLIASIPQIMHPGTESKSTIAMKTILKQAELRGEVHLENLNPRIISLPIDLLRYEILITHEPISDRTIHEIVDDIFLPIVQV
ncbi:MAG: TetR/AcrR family transcriptional regulator [Methanoregula sp.]|jgi:AcrR family transcriptional regulator|uniref:TetR/AcrR family transcriptional regulator n=1 Tax=Methanoregula sp. TaxID=2052170 RepID=UPI0025D29EB8|nr:TetR/AcrR family transcriptional regulator [Methanoregula sp.]MCK9632110.1 TetR/AcrR family transcriptional regulator [Methanoregula sp.]